MAGSLSCNSINTNGIAVNGSETISGNFAVTGYIQTLTSYYYCGGNWVISPGRDTNFNTVSCAQVSASNYVQSLGVYYSGGVIVIDASRNTNFSAVSCYSVTVTGGSFSVGSISINGSNNTITAGSYAIIGYSGLVIDSLAWAYPKHIYMTQGSIVCSNIATIPSLPAPQQGWIIGDHLGSKNEVGAASLSIGGINNIITNSGSFNGTAVSLNAQGQQALYTGGLVLGGYYTILNSRDYYVNSINIGVYGGTAYNFVDQYRNITGVSLNVGAGIVTCGELDANTTIRSGGILVAQSGIVQCAINTTSDIQGGRFLIGANCAIDQYMEFFAYAYWVRGYSMSAPVINQIGQFVGNGVTCAQGIAGTGFNLNDGSGNVVGYGQTGQFTVHDSANYNRYLLYFQGGILVNYTLLGP
jgi:hypothetical protein